MQCWVPRFVGLLGMIALVAAGGCAAPSPSAAPPATLPAIWQTEMGRGEQSGITFGTYNVNGLSNLPGLRADLARLAFVDVWTLQEVRLPAPAAGQEPATRPAAAALASILPPGPWHVLYVPVNPEADGTCEGQAIISRWPIARAEVWPLEHSAPKQRVALAAWIATPAGQVLVVNTDHEVSGWAEWGWPRVSDRRRQVRALVAHLADCGSAPVVVSGDFNTCGSVAECTSSRAEIRALNASMAQVDLRPLGTDFERLPTYIDLGGFYRKHVDHLFLGAQLTGDAWEVCRSATGSNHYPVWCRGRIQANRARGPDPTPRPLIAEPDITDSRRADDQ